MSSINHPIMSGKSTYKNEKRIFVDVEIHNRLQIVLQILRKNTRGIQNRNQTVNQNDVIRFLLDSSSSEIVRIYTQNRDSESTYRRMIGNPRSGESRGWIAVQAQLDGENRLEAESKEDSQQETEESSKE